MYTMQQMTPLELFLTFFKTWFYGFYYTGYSFFVVLR